MRRRRLAAAVREAVFERCGPAPGGRDDERWRYVEILPLADVGGTSAADPPAPGDTLVMFNGPVRCAVGTIVAGTPRCRWVVIATDRPPCPACGRRLRWQRPAAQWWCRSCRTPATEDDLYPAARAALLAALARVA